MIDFVLVESGGSKSSWRLLSLADNQKFDFTTSGLHPAELSEEKSREIASHLRQFTFSPSLQTYFYGAGCESSILIKGLQVFLENHGLVNVVFKSDLTAACIATLGNKSGYAGILGTGAVVAEFDGEKVVRYTSGLGYILGDEGSGFDIGKRIINAYFRNELNPRLSELVEHYFQGRDNIIPLSYSANNRKLIAGLAKVFHPYRKEKFVAPIIDAAFSDFHKTALLPLGELKSLSLVGSIASHYSEEIETVMRDYGIQIDVVLNEAIDALLDYHLNELKKR